MMTHLPKLLRRRLENFHHAQGGAIIILVLAGFLILILSSLMMFDAGRAASDKMEVQTAADTAAYSQSVIKARTMNMLTYANTAKRMIYSYVYVYWAALEGLFLGWVYYASQCFRIWPDLDACAKWVVGLAQIIAQIIRLVSQDWSTMSGRSVDEVKNLDNFQHYMVNITPWWAYAENLVRGIYNGATATAAWPPPSSGLTNTMEEAYQIVDEVTEIVNDLNLGFSINFQIERTTIKDSLPVAKGDGVMAHAGYCGEYFMSPEHLIAAFDFWNSSKDYPQGISLESMPLVFTAASLFNPLNCMIASFFLGDAVLDYRVDTGALGWNTSPTPNDWMQSTSNITLAYMAGAHRKHSRTNFNKLLGDYDHNESKLMKSNGHWAMARSEIVYGDSYMTGGDGFLGSLGGFVSGLSGGILAGLIGPPNMWSPRWTAKLRPMALPGETLGSTTNGSPVGLKAVFVDTLPYFAITSVVSGLFDRNFEFDDALGDFVFFYAASAGYTGDNLEGLTQ